MKHQIRVIASGFALLAFAVAVIAGLASGNPGSLVLGRSLIALIVAQAVGMAAGALLAHVGEEHLRMYEAARPIPDMSLAGARPAASAPSGDEKISQNVSQRR